MPVLPRLAHGGVQGEFPTASRGEEPAARRAVGRGADGPGGVLASHINPFVNTHIHGDNAKPEEHKWTLRNNCGDKPGAVSSKNSRVCVVVEKSVCLHPSGRSLARLTVDKLQEILKLHLSF